MGSFDSIDLISRLIMSLDISDGGLAVIDGGSSFYTVVVTVSLRVNLGQRDRLRRF